MHVSFKVFLKAYAYHVATIVDDLESIRVHEKGYLLFENFFLQMGCWFSWQFCSGITWSDYEELAS
jgi:hypothetical protein